MGISLSPRFDDTLRNVPRRNARICYVQRNELRTTTFCFSTSLRTPLRFSTLCALPQFNSTICLSIYRNASPRLQTQRSSTQCNDLFVYLSSHLVSSLCFALLRYFSPLYAIQRFVCLFIAAPPRVSAHRSTPQRKDLFVTSRLHVTSLNPTPRGAFQRNELKLK